MTSPNAYFGTSTNSRPWPLNNEPSDTHNDGRKDDYDYCKFCQHHDCRYCRFNPANKLPRHVTSATQPTNTAGRIPYVGIDRASGRLSCTDYFSFAPGSPLL